MHKFHKFIIGIKLYMFRTDRLSIIRSFSLYTQQWYMSYRFANLYDIHHCYVYGEKLLMMDRGTVRHMQSFIPIIKFEKLVHLVSFITRIEYQNPSLDAILGQLDPIYILTTCFLQLIFLLLYLSSSFSPSRIDCRIKLRLHVISPKRLIT